jgi:hypothetical protein
MGALSDDGMVPDAHIVNAGALSGVAEQGMGGVITRRRNRRWKSAAGRLVSKGPNAEIHRHECDVCHADEVCSVLRGNLVCKASQDDHARAERSTEPRRTLDTLSVHAGQSHLGMGCA